MEHQSYLAHHGIKGQKWGVRRFESEDGTLTEEGKKRYGQQLAKNYRTGANLKAFGQGGAMLAGVPGAMAIAGLDVAKKITGDTGVGSVNRATRVLDDIDDAMRTGGNATKRIHDLGYESIDAALSQAAKHKQDGDKLLAITSKLSKAQKNTAIAVGATVLVSAGILIAGKAIENKANKDIKEYRRNMNGSVDTSTKTTAQTVVDKASSKITNGIEKERNWWKAHPKTATAANILADTFIYL